MGRSNAAPPNLGCDTRTALSFPFLQGLKNRETRDSLGLYFVEGLRFAHSALDANAPICGYAYCPELLAKHNGSSVMARLARYPRVRLNSQEISQLEFAPEPQGLLLVLKQRHLPLTRVRLKRCETWLGLESIRNPGNLGTMLRSARASATDGLMIFGNRGQTVDPFDPLVLRASMGAALQIPIVKTTYRELREWRLRSEIRVLGADSEGTIDYRKVRFRRNILLMVGEERGGLSPGQRSVCDGFVRVPMAKGVDSLNVAMAATLLLFEAYAQRHSG